MKKSYTDAKVERFDELAKRNKKKMHKSPENTTTVAIRDTAFFCFSLNETGISLNKVGGMWEMAYLCSGFLKKLSQPTMIMKKFALLLAVLMAAVTSQAGSYTYLTFETTDGAKVSVPVDRLTLTISGNTLTAGSQTFTLVNLAKMYFSASDEGTETGIESASSATLDEAAEIYDLQGHKVSRGQMRRGAYIVKTKERTYKIVVK